MAQNTFTSVLDGTTPITAYQLICRDNDSANKIKYNTGVVQLDEPFYAVDAYGNIVPFDVDVPASSASLDIDGIPYISDGDATVVNITTNVYAKLQAGVTIGSYVLLSTNGGRTWSGAANPVIGISFSGRNVQLTFTNELTGRYNRIKILEGALEPVDSHYGTPTEDLVTADFIGKASDSLVALHVSSAYISVGNSFTATVEGADAAYELNRSGVVSIKTGNTEYASRVSDAEKIGYSILGDTIYLYVGASVPAGSYTMSYTDSALTGSPKIVSAAIVITASGVLTYTSVETDADRRVLTFNMTDTVQAASGGKAKIQTSVDGGAFSASNPVIGMAVTNIDSTYSSQAVHTLSIEFTNPLDDNTVVRFLTGAFKDGNNTDNAQFDTQVIQFPVDDASDGQDDDVWVAVPNSMVNGKQYKWLLRVWSVYNADKRDSNMIESYEVGFSTYSAPVITVTGESVITSRTGVWEGSYSQAQNVPLMWHEWTLLIDGDVIDGSGRVYSSVAPSYTYNGLLTDTTYMVKLLCMSQNGVTSYAEFESEVSYAEFGVEGSITATARSDGSIEVTAKQADYITGRATGPYSYSADTPAVGHTSVYTADSTTISFTSAQDFGVDWSEGDTLVLRVHSFYDGVILSYESEDGTFSCELSHRGLVGGLAPSGVLYPSNALYPAHGDFGEFVYKVNGVEIDTFSTDNYGLCWYTVALSYDNMSVLSHRVY